MKRSLLLFFFCVLSIALANAQATSSPFELGTFQITIKKRPGLVPIQVNRSIDQSYDLAYQNRQKTCEIRLLEFRKVVSDASEADMKLSFAALTRAVVMNMVGKEKYITRIIPFDAAGVRRQVNGDSGYAVFAKYDEARSDFFRGYKYAVIACYLSYQKGIVVEAIMFNSLDVMKEPDYAKNTDIFMF